ncbi:serine/threonine-protein phosphatase 4 regulatory subunit 2 [Mytilus galloprovincialis]|uniref:Serine/threonine-protein phosphatase 4 regulatory subunit 2 n=1 Tax=Mytilus galloprovincialis TaxID=29158 RepID=A0A8B6BUT9_MYTGA|nr:serine/threonine-protein phosphatase 4 regulatory subunit 2 [Mytilus galloprovincialis]
MGGICHNGRTQLKIIDGNLNALRYRDEVLNPIVLPFIRQRGFNHVFQQDKARCHVARICMQYFEQNHIRVLPWPALSPDLSPIEHLWDQLGRRVREGQNPPETLQDLRLGLIREWNNIPQANIMTLIGSMRQFEKKPCTEIPPLLDQYLHQVAKTGKTLFPWHQLKKLFVSKVDLVMTQFKETSPTDLLQTTPNIEPVKYDEMRKRILSLMDEFQGAPFTVQRLCELINEPKRHYKRCDKFLRGIEKNVSVVTTIDPFGRKIVSESQVMVNGLDSNGINEAFPKPSPFSSFPTPTQSAWPSFVDKLFGSNQPKQTQSNIDKEEVTSEGNGEDEHLTEQILPESSNAYETETVGTESKDEDTNNEDVFTKSTNSPDHKESSDSLPSLSESANLEEKSAVIDEVPEVNQEEGKTEQNDVEQLDSSDQAEETEKIADTCDNAEKTETTQCDDDSDSVKSQKNKIFTDEYNDLVLFQLATVRGFLVEHFLKFTDR